MDFGVIMVCQCRFILGKKCSIQVNDVGKEVRLYTFEHRGDMGSCCVFSLCFKITALKR